MLSIAGEQYEVSERVEALVRELLSRSTDIDGRAVGAVVLFFSTGKVWSELRLPNPARKVG